MLFKSTNKYIFLLLIHTLYPSTALADTSITISSGKAGPFVTPEHNGFYDYIVKEIFQRIGLNAKAELIPSERSLINADTGINDGNIARIKGIEKKYPNLIMVPEKIINYEFVAFTKNKNIKITNWKDLENYNVAYITGWKIFEKNVNQYKSIIKTQNVTQLFELLHKDRVDIILYDRWGGVWKSKQFTSNIFHLDPPIVSKKMYLYVNKKHEKLIPKLSKSIKEIKSDGTYKRFFDITLNN